MLRAQGTPNQIRSDVLVIASRACLYVRITFPQLRIVEGTQSCPGSPPRVRSHETKNFHRQILPLIAASVSSSIFTNATSVSGSLMISMKKAQQVKTARFLNDPVSAESAGQRRLNIVITQRLIIVMFITR